MTSTLLSSRCPSPIFSRACSTPFSVRLLRLSLSSLSFWALLSAVPGSSSRNRASARSALSSLPVAFRQGPITNPAWYVSVNNDVVASGAVTAEIPNGDKLVVNSKDGYLEVAEYTVSSNEFVRNLYQFTDFDRETFVLFPPGNSTLFVSAESETKIEAWVQIEEIHETI